MSIELKIKSKHLSEEARIIRFEEKKLLKNYRWEINRHKALGHNEPLIPYSSSNYITFESLHNHRKWDVRNENRATFLARAYIAGVPYANVEQKRKDETNFLQYILPRVVSMVSKYGKKKIVKEVWEGSYPSRKKVKSPEYIQLEKDIKEWSKN
jgi:hypothetical protein